MSRNQGPNGKKHTSTGGQQGKMKLVTPQLPSSPNATEDNRDYYLSPNYTWLKVFQKLNAVSEI